MMPTCREVTRLLASDQLERAALTKRILTRLHLMMCDGCRRYARELEGLGEMAREALRAPLDPTRLAALELAILERAASGGGGAG
jgi:predicted anti-sigma-YlaC factor YlaD